MKETAARQLSRLISRKESPQKACRWTIKFEVVVESITYQSNEQMYSSRSCDSTVPETSQAVRRHIRERLGVNTQRD